MINQALKWNVDPVMFTLSMEWHFIWTLLCVVLGYYFLMAAIKNPKKNDFQINLSIIIIMFIILIGGRLAYGLLAQSNLLFGDPVGFFTRWTWSFDFRFERPVRWYGLLFAMSFVVGSFIGSWVYRRENKAQKTLDRLILCLAIGTVVGARLGHCIFYNPEYYFSNPIRILRIWEGGLASHGAGIGLLLAVWYYTKTTKGFSFFWVFDRLTIVIAISGCFIRLGNFMNSEIMGKRTSSSLGVIFERVDNVPRHPAQLYESINYLIIFLVLLGLYITQSKKIAPGFLTGTAFISGFVTRFLIEFFKERQVSTQSEMILNMGQWLSIPMVLFGVYVLYRSIKATQKQS